MEIHHSKHHNGYTNNLNNAVSGTEMENKTIEEICMSENLSAALRNNGGGFYNHCLFWQIMSPDGGGEPIGEIAGAIENSFGGFENFKIEFAKAAGTRFGSGWAWLCVKNGELDLCSTANQDNPLMNGGCGGTPILAIDVWEHAYYLNYQNRRPDYINAFFNVIDWNEVNRRYLAAL
jgi:Fe-Mn family superoxide dismutase